MFHSLLIQTKLTRKMSPGWPRHFSPLLSCHHVINLNKQCLGETYFLGGSSVYVSLFARPKIWWHPSWFSNALLNSEWVSLVTTEIFRRWNTGALVRNSDSFNSYLWTTKPILTPGWLAQMDFTKMLPHPVKQTWTKWQSTKFYCLWTTKINKT